MQHALCIVDSGDERMLWNADSNTSCRGLLETAFHCTLQLIPTVSGTWHPYKHSRWEQYQLRLLRTQIYEYGLVI